jgi:hypothetical protein
MKRLRHPFRPIEAWTVPPLVLDDILRDICLEDALVTSADPLLHDAAKPV